MVCKRSRTSVLFVLLLLLAGSALAGQFEETCFQQLRKQELIGTETGNAFTNKGTLAYSDKFTESMRISALRVCINPTKQLIVGIQIGLFDYENERKLILPVLGMSKGQDCSALQLESADEYISSLVFRTVPNKGIISLIAKTSTGNNQSFLTGFKTKRNKFADTQLTFTAKQRPLIGLYGYSTNELQAVGFLTFNPQCKPIGAALELESTEEAVVETKEGSALPLIIVLILVVIIVVGAAAAYVIIKQKKNQQERDININRIEVEMLDVPESEMRATNGERFAQNKPELVDYNSDDTIGMISPDVGATSQSKIGADRSTNLSDLKAPRATQIVHMGEVTDDKMNIEEI